MKFHLAVKIMIQDLRIIVLKVLKQSTVNLCYCVSRTANRPIIQTSPGTRNKIRETILYKRQHTERRKDKVTSSKNIRTVILTL
jgi:hypothetical protein